MERAIQIFAIINFAVIGPARVHTMESAT